MNNAWLNQEKVTFNYDANGNLLEEITTSWSNGSWVNSGKLTYHYTNGIITKISDHNHGAAGWNNFAQLVNITWHNQALLQMASYTTKIDWGTGFEDYARATITYQPNGGTTIVEEIYNNGIWVNSRRKTWVYDTQGNFLAQKVENWTGNTWVISSGHQLTLTYNANNDLIERVTSNYQAATNAYVPNSKEVYANFIQIVAGVKETTELTVAVFPNPAQDVLNIRIPKPDSYATTAALTDLTGRTVRSQNIAGGVQHAQLEISTLPKGVYLLHLSNGEGRQVLKVVKQ